MHSCKKNDVVNLPSCPGHNVQPRFCWGDLKKEKLIGHNLYVRSQSNYVSSWYNEGDASLETASLLQALPKTHCKKLKAKECQISSRDSYPTRNRMLTMCLNFFL